MGLLGKLKEKFEKLFYMEENQNNNWGYPWSPMGDKPLDFKTISTTGYHYNQADA